MNQPIILNEISKRFGDRIVLDRVSAVFDAPVVLITGVSGCGKTTLLNILLGFIRPDMGSITGMPDKVSVVFQEDRLSETLGVAVNLCAAVPGVTVSDALALLDELGVDAPSRQPVSEFSGGMKRRVAIARALLYDAPLLVLDEPFRGLDTAAREQAAALILRRSEGKRLIVVSHDENDPLCRGAQLLRLPTHA